MLIDQPGLQSRYGEDGTLMHELVEMFREDAPSLAGRLVAAIDANNPTAAWRAVHTLIGAALNVCAEDLVAEGGRVEAALRSGDLSRARALAAELSGVVTETLEALREAA